LEKPKRYKNRKNNQEINIKRNPHGSTINISLQNGFKKVKFLLRANLIGVYTLQTSKYTTQYTK